MIPMQTLLVQTSRLAIILFVALSLAACSSDDPLNQESRPPEVGVISAQPEEVHLTAAFSGRLEPWRIAEVRAQVAGVVLKREFVEGATVEAGQTLFQIDPAPYQARVAEEAANLAVARANLLKAKAQNDRTAALGKLKVVSELDEITTEASYQQALAQVEAAKAALDSAKLDLGHATVKASISGRIGRSLVTEGALVGEGEATHMATIQQVEPIYASFNQSSADALKLRSSYVTKSLTLTEDNAVPVRLTLENGERYPHSGRLLFGEVNVDPATGQINFRAEVPNPDRLLLPGMFVRVVLEQALFEDAFLVPQKAVTRNEHGDTLLVVDATNTVIVKPVTIVGEKANQWIISEGLEVGEQIMIDSFYKAPPGRVVTPLLQDNERNRLAGE